MNATQAMESSDERRMLLRTRREGTPVAVEVGDTGVGIPDQDLEKIFDPFRTTRAPGIGTGLGLSLAHSNRHRPFGNDPRAQSAGGGNFLRGEPSRGCRPAGHRSEPAAARPR